MQTTRPLKPGVNSGWIHSTRLHAVMYSMLLVVTPFILLQNFLVEIIAKVSGSTVELAGSEIPVLPYIAFILLIACLIIFRSYLTKLRLLAGVIAILMFGLAQQFTDYYFDHNFYDLQQNWHYIAYCIFAFMVYRDLAPRGRRMAKIILITFFAALLFSSFDETFQLYMSGRVFDISDIAKDVWGALTGIVLLYIGRSRSNTLKADMKKIRQPKLRAYLKAPFSLLILLFVLAILFLFFSSLLTDFPYWYIAVLFTLGSFAVFFILFHFSQFKGAKYSFLTIFIIIMLVQSYFFVKHRSDNIVYNRYGLTVYKGIPIVFFDVMIFSDGTFRLVDKKHYFYRRDRAFFVRQKADIIIIGTGAYGKGGRGYADKISQFIYNPYTNRGTQVVIMKTPEACQYFNRLKREQKNVLFILHNTC